MDTHAERPHEWQKFDSKKRVNPEEIIRGVNRRGRPLSPHLRNFIESQEFQAIWNDSQEMTRLSVLSIKTKKTEEMQREEKKEISPSKGEVPLVVANDLNILRRIAHVALTQGIQSAFEDLGLDEKFFESPEREKQLVEAYIGIFARLCEGYTRSFNNSSST